MLRRGSKKARLRSNEKVLKISGLDCRLSKIKPGKREQSTSNGQAGCKERKKRRQRGKEIGQERMDTTGKKKQRRTTGT